MFRRASLFVCLIFSGAVVSIGALALVGHFQSIEAERPPGLAFFGYGLCAVGLANLALARAAWHRRHAWSRPCATGLGIAAVAIALLSSLDSGGVNGLEGIVILALIGLPALANRYAISFVARSDTA